MERAELQNFPKFPLWIIEYVWAHKMMDIQEAVDPADWPDVDSQPLNLEDSWRLRVTSARVCSIVKNRDVEHFERVMGFLETTYRLLPRLVAPIKHMKIMFGLKTMVIMWMLREGRGMVDTVFKINQFFPSTLPQYQDQCSQHEMFLMRKNHQDFKALAQVLTMDKDKLEDYMKGQMEDQYGEHYAQKVEDRLVHYLHELGSVLPGDTYIDKILKKDSPVTEEEKLLLDVVTSDSTNIATTLKKLLHCDVAFCRQSRTSQSSAHGKEGMESSELSESILYDDSSEGRLKSGEGLQFQPEVCQGDDILSLENDNDSDVQQTGDGGEVEEISQRSSESVQEAALSPQFCSKHQRWVKSILQECPDEELLLQANVSSSPPLFQSSTSGTSSSQDLTPSDLTPGPPDQQRPPSETSTHLTASEQAHPTDVQSSGSESDTSLQPSSSRDALLPAMLSPVVRLVDIGIYPTFQPHQAPLNHSTALSNKQVAQTPTSPHFHTSGNNSTPQTTMKDAVVPTNLPNTVYNRKIQTAPVSQDASTFVSCQPPTRRPFSKLSKKFRRACSSQPQDGLSQNSLAEQIEKAPTNVSSSPPLFQSSTSGTLSSQDLTPSDPTPGPPDQQRPPSEMSTHLTASEQAHPTDVQSSGSASDTSLQPSSSRDTLLPAMLSPVVRLVDIASVRGIYSTFQPHQAPINHSTASSNKQVAQAPTSPHCHTSGNNSTPQTTMKDAVVPTNLPNTAYNNKIQTAPVSQDASTVVSCQPPTRRTFSKLSRKFRPACLSPAQDGLSQNSLAERIEKAPSNVSSSPPQFQSSTSGTLSSQDLTPSDPTPGPPDQQRPPSEMSTHLTASEQAHLTDVQSSGSASDTSLQPSSSRDTLLPAMLSPVVRLVDIASVRGIYPTFEPHQAPLNHSTASSNKQLAQTPTSPHCNTSGNNSTPQTTMKNAVVPTNLPNTAYNNKIQTAPVSQDASTVVSCQPPTRRPFSKLSKKFRRACSSQPQDGLSQNSLAEQIEKAPSNVSSSPPLFQSSTSGTSSSQDFTPSDLTPGPPDQQRPPSETSTHLTPSRQTQLTDVQSSDAASDTSLQPSSSRDTLLPAMLSPVVRLVDIASVRGIYPTFQPYQAPLNHSTASSNKQVAQTPTSPHCNTSGNNSTPQTTMKDAVVPTNLPNTTYNNKIQTAPVSQDASTVVSCQPPTRRTFSKLSRKFRQALAEHIEKAPTNISGSPTQDASASTSQSRPPISTKSSQEVVPQNSIPSHSTVASSTSNSSRVQLRLSLPSQAVLLQSKLLQPFVTLTRLSTQEWRSSTRYVEPAEQGRREDDEEDADSSFDLNTLYSSHSSSNDSEDSLLCDPDYKPRIKKKRFLLEYDADF